MKHLSREESEYILHKKGGSVYFNTRGKGSVISLSLKGEKCNIFYIRVEGMIYLNTRRESGVI